MRDALADVGRPIVFSACEWGVQVKFSYSFLVIRLTGPSHRIQQDGLAVK